MDMTPPSRAIATAALVTLFLSPVTTARASPQPASSPERIEAPERSHDDGIEAFSGHYRFAGGARELKARDAAIDEVVQEMSWIVRAAARKRLTRLNEIPRELTLRLGDEALTMVLPDAVYQAPLDGTPVMVEGPSGDDVVLTNRPIGSRRLRQRFTSDDGIRINVCDRRGDDGLVIRVQMHSDKLPKDLVYTLTFARDD